ncbi:hypothetical protein LSH36_304g00000 [Paralvinella palmiformis]|uniref:Uncharacterized protein n=1 Tax=Paralvinella palmiformis TaxID=53620 RepID=A0AAD9JHH5_9ANNE|nr:hypothetical protein LSH36_304g00000 [Paralvinella palmiformis]
MSTVDCQLGSCYKQHIKGTDDVYQRSCIQDCKHVDKNDVTNVCCNTDLCNHGNKTSSNLLHLSTLLTFLISFLLSNS